MTYLYLNFDLSALPARHSFLTNVRPSWLNSRIPQFSFPSDEEWVRSSFSAYGCLGAVSWMNYDVITQGEDLFSDIAD
jgi:hypothetical protein